MPQFDYTGVDKKGKKTGGTIEAEHEGAARMVLRSMGVRPQRLAKAGTGAMDLGKALSAKGGATVKLELLVVFTRQLQVLISSGVPVVQGLEILSEQSVDKNLKAILTQLRTKVSEGAYLWDAMRAFPRAFPNMYTSLIRAGETSGSIDQMLKRLSSYMEDSQRLRKMVKGAMMYPIIVCSIAVVVIAVMLIFVIPKFEELLKGNGQELPGPTQFVIDLSHFMVNNVFIIVGGAAAAGYLGTNYLRTKEGRATLDRLVFRIPIFGDVARKSGIARFSRTMQTLLASGVNLIDAIDICKATVDNAVIEEAVSRIRKDVESGMTLGMVVNRLSVFPKMAVQMIAVGESTGNLDKMLEKVADFYEEEVEALIAGMSKLIEPLILVVLGGTVGGLLIAMYLPIFKLAGGSN